MDSRLVITVLLATLSWGFLGTYGQNSTTAAPMNMTTANMNSMNTTTANMNSMNMTTANMNPMNMTTANMNSMNMTTANMNSMNMTTANMNSMNMTTANMNSMNMTTANMNPMNMTTANMTTGNMTTTMATTMTPFTANTTVSNLTASPTREGCGSSRLCVAEPSTCDPSSAGSCFFLSAMQQSGRDFRCEVSGTTNGYIGAVLSVDTMLGGNDTTYICANNSGNVQFIGASLNNNMLTETMLDVNNVSGRVNGGTIQCIFTVRVPAVITNRTLRTTSFSTSLITGTFDPMSGTLGVPTARVTTNIVNLADPNATVVNMANNTTTTTATPATTGHGVTVHHSLMQSLLITLIVVGLAML